MKANTRTCLPRFLASLGLVLSTEDLKRFTPTDLGRANQLGAGAPTPQAGLAVTALGQHYQPDPRRVGVQQSHADPGGSTSIRNHDRQRGQTIVLPCLTDRGGPRRCRASGESGSPAPSTV